MRLRAAMALLAPLVLWGPGCRGTDAGTGSNTNWVGCRTDYDCVERGAGNACVEGVCADEPVAAIDAGLQPTTLSDAEVEGTVEAEPSHPDAGKSEPSVDAALVAPTSVAGDPDASPGELDRTDSSEPAPSVTRDAQMADSAPSPGVLVSAEGELEWTLEVDATVATLPWDLAAGLGGDMYLLAHGIGAIDADDTQGRVAPKVIKYDATGTQLWEQSAAPRAEGEAYSGGLAVSATGEVYVTAVVGGPGADAHSILTKYAVDGRAIFSEELGAQGNEIVCATALDAEDNVYAVGEAMQDVAAAFIEKRSADGVVVWSQVSVSRDSATDVAVDTQGNVLVTGLVLGAYDEALGHAPQDLFLRKYSSDGDLLWDRGSSLEGQLAGWSVGVDAADNVYVAAGREAPADPFAAPETILLKFDAEGAPLWNQSWAGTYSEFPTGIAVEPNGNAYVSSHAIAPDGMSYATIGKYSAEGEQLWARDWGAEASFDSADVAINSEGYLFVTGTWVIAARESTPERRGSYLKRFR